MSSRAPATTNGEIIAAVASLTARMDALHDGQGRIEAKVDAVAATVGTHALQITEWKRDGKWLASALVGLGALVAFVAAMARDWLMHLWTR